MKIVIILILSLQSSLYSSVFDDFIIKLKSDKASKMLYQGNYEEAIKLYSEAIDINKNSTEVYNNMAITLSALGEKSEALETFGVTKKTFNEKTKNRVKSSVYYNSGVTAIETKRYKEAVGDLINSLYYNPDDDNAREALEYARKRIDEESGKRPKSNEEDEDLGNNNSSNESTGNKEEIDKSDIDKLLESLRRLRKESDNKEEYYNGESFEKDW